MSRTISIVTPWRNHVRDLLPDYARACEGAQIIAVDNGSDEVEAATLRAYAAPRGAYLRNAHNVGFARANNQGYDCATGDIILFVNNDIAADPAWLEQVADDVEDGALYGPSLQQQFVAGMWVPYLEGWCIAATRRTWQRLARTGDVWDAEAYPQPYWEDNDLCLRALEAGLALVQTAWPIAHKGGRTAGALLNHAAAFERNRATFAQRVIPHANRLAQRAQTPVLTAYQRNLMQSSDIRHHLPLLFSLAHSDVLELGVRAGVSTSALLAGVEARGGHVWSVDCDPACAVVAHGHPQWTFTLGNSVDAQLASTLAEGRSFALALLDTEHTYAHVTQELMLWTPRMAEGGIICVHDTETFPGVRAAVEAFCAAHRYPVRFVLPDNGLAIIEVRR